jgi:hypothetical protein
VIVIGGLLAFSSIRKQPDWITGVLVSVLFCFFAYKNLDAIHDVSLQRFALLDTIHQIPSAAVSRASELLESTLLPPAFEGVRTFHITCDVLTVAALWAMELRRIRASRLSQARSL